MYKTRIEIYHSRNVKITFLVGTIYCSDNLNTESNVFHNRTQNVLTIT